MEVMLRALLLALMLVFSTRADAGSGIAVAVTGEATMHAEVIGQFQIWIKQRGYALGVMDPDAINTITDCFVIEDANCSRGTFEKRGTADHLVFVRIVLETGEQGRKVSLTGHWFAKTRDTIAEKRTCERCDVAALAKTVDELMTALVKTGGQKSRLKVGSKPAGLIVALDGTNIGVTPLERDVPPGPHKLSLLRGRTIVAERAITIEPGKVAEITIVADAGATDASERKRKPSRVVAGVAIGVGATAIVVGGVLFTTGQDETGQRRTYRDTEPLGIGMIAGGATIAGVGALLWLRNPRSDATPIISINTAGASVGWAGRF